MYENEKVSIKQNSSSTNTVKSQEHQQVNSSCNRIMQLQSVIGNRAVTRLLSQQNSEKESAEPIQMKNKIKLDFQIN